MMDSESAVITEKEVEQLLEIARKLPRFKTSLPFATSHTLTSKEKVKF